jgi:hypothetical protein
MLTPASAQQWRTGFCLPSCCVGAKPARESPIAARDHGLVVAAHDHGADSNGGAGCRLPKDRQGREQPS